MNILTARRGTAAVLFLAGWTLAHASRQGSGGVLQPKIHIRLVDHAGLPGKILSHAEAIVKAVFRQAGVSADFIDCASSPISVCRTETADGDYWLQILDHRPEHIKADAAGYAVLVASAKSADSYAVVSLPLVNSAAQELDACTGDVLGAAMLHELGHLLLHSSTHSHTGVMKARLDRSQLRLLERGELFFTTEEAARITDRARP